MRSQIRTIALAAALSTAVLLSATAPFANAATLTTADPAATAQVSDWHTCISGYVWREARSTDKICVTPATRSQTAYDNSQASARRNPNGAYGPNTCVNGYVWREAYDGDVVCVTPSIRAQAKYDNDTEYDHRVHLSW